MRSTSGYVEHPCLSNEKPVVARISWSIFADVASLGETIYSGLCTQIPSSFRLILSGYYEPCRVIMRQASCILCLVCAEPWEWPRGSCGANPPHIPVGQHLRHQITGLSEICYWTQRRQVSYYHPSSHTSPGMIMVGAKQPHLRRYTKASSFYTSIQQHHLSSGKTSARSPCCLPSVGSISAQITFSHTIHACPK